MPDSPLTPTSQHVGKVPDSHQHKTGEQETALNFSKSAEPDIRGIGLEAVELTEPVSKFHTDRSENISENTEGNSLVPGEETGFSVWEASLQGHL